MGRLINSPSGGQSEVLETLHFQGAISSGVQIFRLGPMVSHRWKGDEDREGSDAQFEADILTILAELQTAGYVVGHADATGNVVDLTSGTPPSTTRIVLTGAGRVQARHPRPRPVADPWRGGG
jgi:hypothetical protein